MTRVPVAVLCLPWFNGPSFQGGGFYGYRKGLQCASDLHCHPTDRSGHLIQREFEKGEPKLLKHRPDQKQNVRVDYKISTHLRESCEGSHPGLTLHWLIIWQ